MGWVKETDSESDYYVNLFLLLISPIMSLSRFKGHLYFIITLCLFYFILTPIRIILFYFLPYLTILYILSNYII